MKTNARSYALPLVARATSPGLVATLFWLSVASGLAQSGGWTNRYSSPYSGPNTSKDQASKVVCDRDGNIIVTGASRGSITFDILTIKYSSAGVALWTNRYNGPADGDDSGNAVAVDGSGNVLVTGSRTRSLYNLDYYTAKYAAADGALLWEQSYNGPADDNDFAIAVAVDGSGNAVVTGRSYTFESGSFNPDYYTAKYAAADGALLWERRYSGTYSGSIDETSALALDASGDVIVTGNSTRGQYNADYYTAKYAAADGSLLWEQRYNGPADKSDNASAVAVDGSGNVVVTGSSYDSGSVPNLYTAKYAAADGSLVWEQRYSGPANISDGGTAVAVDGSGNVVVTGGSYNSSFTSDYYTAKYAAGNGALLWEKRYNGPANNTDAPLAVAVDRSDNVAVTGWSRNSNGYDDYYTAKYAAATGALMAEKRYDGPTHLHDRSAAVAMDRNGDVVVTGSSDAGTASAENLDFVTIKYVLNHSPVVANPIPDRNGLYGTPFSFQFAANTFTDSDAGQTLTYSAVGMPSGIGFTPATRTISGTPTNLGTFAVTVTATDNGSPTLNTNDVFDLVVGKAPLTVTADNKSRPYGDPNPPLTLSYTGFVLGENESVLDSPPVATTAAETNSPVGSYPIVLSGGSDDHYSLTLSNGTLTVTPAPLTVTIDNTNRLAGQTNPVFTGTLAGVVNADNITVTFTSPATESSPLGTYPMLPVFSDPDLKLGNYSVVTNGGTLTLLPEAITLDPATLPNGLVGVAYSQSLTATGGTAPHTFTLASGTLPDGLTLTGAGLLSGTSETNGLFAVSIAAADVHGCATTNGYSLAILPLPTLTILQSGSDVVLSWSTNYPEFQLLCTTNVTDASWATAAPPAVVTGEQLVVTNTIGEQHKFYRLQLP